MWFVCISIFVLQGYLGVAWARARCVPHCVVGSFPLSLSIWCEHLILIAFFLPTFIFLIVACFALKCAAPPAVSARRLLCLAIDRDVWPWPCICMARFLSFKFQPTLALIFYAYICACISKFRRPASIDVCTHTYMYMHICTMKPQKKKIWIIHMRMRMHYIGRIN